MKGEQPEAWESERRQAAIWCVQFNGDGWVRLPPLVEDKLEHAHQNHATDVTLEVSSLFQRLPFIALSCHSPRLTLQHVPVFKAGEYGEQPYAVDLLHGVAKCTLKPFTECLVRRMPVKY